VVLVASRGLTSYGFKVYEDEFVTSWNAMARVTTKEKKRWRSQRKKKR
jgi:hypothetical protein